METVEQMHVRLSERRKAYMEKKEKETLEEKKMRLKKLREKSCKKIIMDCEEMKGNKVIGRMYNANVREGERYFLRLMLLHQRGCKSFEDIRTVNGIVYETYREAAELLVYY